MNETFTKDQIISALKGWADYGEQTYVPEKATGELGHRGYFSGQGWAARVIRSVIAEMENQQQSEAP